MRRSPDEGNLLRISIFLLIGVFLGINASAISWNNPSDGEIFGSNDVILNASSNAKNVSFWGKKSDKSVYALLSNSSANNGFFTYVTEEYGDGKYDLRINNSEGQKTVKGIIFDTQDPALDSSSPSGYISNTSPTVELSASDNGLSGIDYIFLNVTDSEGNVVDETIGESLALTDLSNGTYTVNYNIYDSAGNNVSNSWSFTVDTSYDGDKSPQFPKDKYRLLGKEGSLDLEVSLEKQNENSKITLTCYDSKDEKIDSVTKSVDSDSTTFNCEVDGDDYSDTKQKVWVEMCDQAGNCVDTEGDETVFFFDGTKPSLSDPNILGNVVNGDFYVQFSADDFSGIDKLEYFYDDSTISEGSGNQVDINKETEEFKASISDLNSGSHTIYFRVKDKAGRWSETKSLQFNYRPNAEPKMNIVLPNPIRVEAGESKNFDIRAENTGEIFIENATVSLKAEDLFSKNYKIKELLPGNSKNVSLEISTSTEDLGSYNLTISSRSPPISHQSKIIVEATEEQQERLESKLSKYKKRLNLLQANYSKSKKALDKDLQERFNSNFTDFKRRVNNAEEASKKGEYYRVSKILDGIKSEYQQADKSFENVQKIEQQRFRGMLIWVAGGLTGFIILIMSGVLGFVSYSDEYELPVDIDGELGIVEEIKSLGGTAEREAEEFEWDGFKD